MACIFSSRILSSEYDQSLDIPPPAGILSSRILSSSEYNPSHDISRIPPPLRNTFSTLGDFYVTKWYGAYENWLIAMDKPGGEGATKQQIIDCYIKTLAKVIGCEEEAKKRIYKVSCDDGCFKFGCAIDWETAIKLQELPGVTSLLPDCMVDPESMDYGGDLFDNGEIVPWSPEQERILRSKVYTSCI